MVDFLFGSAQGPEGSPCGLRLAGQRAGARCGWSADHGRLAQAGKKEQFSKYHEAGPDASAATLRLSSAWPTTITLGVLAFHGTGVATLAIGTTVIVMIA